MSFLWLPNLVTFWNSWTSPGSWLTFLSNIEISGLWAREDLFFCNILLGLSCSLDSRPDPASDARSDKPSNMEVTEFLAEWDQNELPSLSFLSNTTEAFFCSLFFKFSSLGVVGVGVGAVFKWSSVVFAAKKLNYWSRDRLPNWIKTRTIDWNVRVLPVYTTELKNKTE